MYVRPVTNFLLNLYIKKQIKKIKIQMKSRLALNFVSTIRISCCVHQVHSWPLPHISRRSSRRLFTTPVIIRTAVLNYFFNFFLLGTLLLTKLVFFISYMRSFVHFSSKYFNMCDEVLFLVGEPEA